jgi:proline iminopeptidase
VARWITTDDGVRLWVESGGSGPGLILLHGGPGLWDYLGLLAASLEDVCSVVRYDQRGAGRSDHVGPYSLERFVADCEAVRADVGFERPVIAGHSWGAALALLYALSHPARVRGVLYIAGIGFDWPRWKEAFHKEYLSRLSRYERERVVELESKYELSPSEEREETRLRWVTDYVDRSRAEDQIGSMLASGFAINHTSNRLLSEELESTDAAEWNERLESVSCPVLIVQGAADPRPIASVDVLAEVLPACDRVVLQAGHFPWVEDAEAFQDVLRSWLGTV